MATQVFGGRYEIVRHLARGGMAEVYLARDRVLDRPVALKVLFPELSADHSFVERFRREARAAAGLNHPDIVSVYDWGEEEGTYFIVMEYVEGRTLREVIDSDAPLQPRRAAGIAADIATALAFAHGRGLIHRDVKPGNVLIGAHGGVKVTDFGIARGGDTGENLTQTGAVMGTATYFSPEQAQGQPLDARTDVYALGVVLYEMLSGAPPFSGDTPLAIAYQHVRDAPVPLSRRATDVAPGLEAIVMKAMAKEPGGRYATAEAMRQDLARFAGQETAGATVMVAPVADATRVAPVVGPVPGGTRVIPAGAAPDEGERRWTRYLLFGLLALILIAGLIVLLAALRGPEGEQVEVPNVVGGTVGEARFTLVQRGFKVDVNPDDAPDEATVTDQDPPAPSTREEGSTIDVTAAAAPATTAPTTSPTTRRPPTTPRTTDAPPTTEEPPTSPPTTSGSTTSVPVTVP